MKFLLTISTLVFTMIFPSTSWSEWTYITKNVEGTDFYIDFERVRKHDGYVYYWVLEDLLEPDKDGDLSYRNYSQGDCELFRLKILSFNYHKREMGEGNSTTFNPKNPEWRYPTPKSVFERLLETVCNQ